MDRWADGWARTDGRTDRGAGQRDCSRPSRTQAPPSERRPGEGGAGAAVWTDELTCAQPVVAGNCSARMRWGDVDARCAGAGMFAADDEETCGPGGGSSTHRTRHCACVGCSSWCLEPALPNPATAHQEVRARWVASCQAGRGRRFRRRILARRRGVESRGAAGGGGPHDGGKGPSWAARRQRSRFSIV